MKSRAGLGVLLLAAALSDGRLIACGDKYLSVGFGTHFERTSADRSAATVLVVAGPGSDLERTYKELAEPRMKKEGYRPRLASSEADLDKALEGCPPQVIITEARRSQELTDRTKGKSHIVPVLYSPTPDALKEARRAFDTVIKTPKKGSTFVDATDDAIVIREIEAEAQAKAAAKLAKTATKTAAKKAC